MADGQADETIVTEFVIKADEAMAKAKQFRSQIDEIKADLKSLVAQSGESLRVAAKGMLEQFKSQQFQGMTQDDFGKTFGKDSAQYQTAIKNIQDYRAALVQAMQETSKEFRAASTEALNYQKAVATATSAGNFQTNVNAMKSSIVSLAQETGKSFKEVADGMKQAFATETWKNVPNVIKQTGVSSAQAMKQATMAVKEYDKTINTALKQIQTEYANTEKAQNSWSKSLLSLGNVIKGIFIGLIYNVVMGIVRGFTQLMSEATTYAYDLVKGVFQLELGIRALRRSGIDITFEDTVKQIKALRDEFGVFTTKELVQGTAAFYNLIRDLGFTREEIEKLQRSIVTLAIVNGRSMDDVQKTVALALSSGYTEGLQRLGVSINRVNIAQQAARMGWEKGYMALTEQQRAMATLVLLNQKVAKYSDDVAKYQESEAGQIDAVTKAIEEQKTMIGEEWLPVKKDLLDALLDVLKFFKAIAGTSDSMKELEKSSQDAEDFSSTIDGAFTKAVSSLESFSERMSEMQSEGSAFWSWYARTIKKQVDFILGMIKSLQDAWNKLISGDFSEELNLTPNFGEDIELIEPDALDAVAQEVEANFKDQLEDILKAQEDFQEDSLDAWEDYKRDLAEIDEDYNQDLEDAARDHYQKLDDIAREYAQDIADSITEYNNDVIDAWNEYYAELEDAAYDYRQAEIQAEKDYQEDLRRLREQFLFDLEDALQARDARAVLNLVRRYNMEKDEAKRNFKDEQEQNQQRYEDEVREAKRRREARLAELYKELQERLAALKLQNQREIAEENLKYNRELLDEYIAWQRRRADREQRYREELDDLKKAMDRQIKELAESLAEQADATETGMENMKKVLAQYLGEGGILDDLWSEYEKLVYEHLDDINTVIEESLKAWNKSFGKSGDEEESSDTTTEDTGGTGSSTKGTTSPSKGTTGKAATDNLDNSSTTASTAIAAPTASMSGKLTVDINLSKGLESEIIDEAMNGMADVLFRSTKR